MLLEEKLKIGARVKGDWENIVKAMAQIKESKEYNCMLKIPLTNLEADARTIYLCLNAFSSLALGPNQNLFTFIHDGKNVLKAYAESTEDGVYTSIKKIEFGGWEKYVNMATPKPEFLFRYKPEFLFSHLKRIAKEKTGIDIGILKMAHIDFFSEFQPYETDSRLEFLARAYPACVAVYDKNLISFYPEPPIFKILRQLIQDANIRPIGEKLEDYAKEIIARTPESKFGLIVKTPKGVISVKIYKDKNDIQIDTQSEFKTYGELKKLSLRKISKMYKSKLDVDFAVAFDSKELTAYLSSLMEHDVPWSEKAYTTFFSESKKFLLKYNNARGIGIKTTCAPLALLSLFE